MSIREFKPTIFFLLKFLGIYLIGNFLYGLYITSFEPRPDPITHIVSVHTSAVLNVCGYPVQSEDRADKPTTNIDYLGKSILSIYEGCNGFNIMIIFLAFVFAFGPMSRAMWWFIPLGLVTIHLFNLMRISLLFLVVEYFPTAMYFTHKYFFTAILYVVIFGFWVWWVSRFSNIKPSHASQES
jgi:exosortase family protein XrtF